MSEIELIGERWWWIGVSPEKPDTIRLGGGIEGMTYTMRNHPDCVTDDRLLDYDCMEDFIEEYIEIALAHEHMHITLFHLFGYNVSTMWDNVDGLFQLTDIR